MSHADATRRSVLQAAGLGAATVLARPAIGQGLRKVSFLCSWQPDGGNFFAWIAQHRGFWKRRGLDVEVLRGSGAAMAIQAVGGSPDRYQFGMAPTSTACIEVAKGLPIICLGMVNYDSQMGIAVAGDGPICDVHQLGGKTWGCTATSGEYPFLSLFAGQAGFDFKTVTVQQVSGSVRDTLLLRHQVDAVSGAASTVVGSLASQGFAIRFFLFRSVGIDFYGQSITTNPIWLKKDPGLCEALVDGAMEGLRYTITNPQDTLDQMLQLHADVALTHTGQKALATSFGIVLALNLQSTYVAKGLGDLDLSILQRANDLVISYAGDKNGFKPTAEQIFDRRFIGRQTVTHEQIAAAQVWSAPYAKYLV